ncbi:MAG: hypothetical protein ACREPD_05450 [Stenotrophomonas sp.]|uniref:hypothetical protein n=1 Tax=Stenotrophomonas sp. TaxID=69392 RepID=UPI003D6C95F1
MSGSVDVLAVIEAAARSLWIEGQPVNAHAADLISARAAVAELIGADEEYDAARLSGNCIRLGEAVTRRRAALARVKGAAA